MNVRVKRVYEPIQKTDGQRVLVDRLWPRGVAKEAAAIDVWVKELTPSDELRKWFHIDKDNRYEEFSKRYELELQTNKTELKQIIESVAQPFVLVTAVQDIDHSHIPTLQKFIAKI